MKLLETTITTLICLIDRELEQRNMQLERMLHVFARSVFKLSKKIYKEALSALAEVGQRELLKIANIVRDEPGEIRSRAVSSLYAVKAC